MPVIWVETARCIILQGCKETQTQWMVAHPDFDLLCQHLPILLQIHPHDLKHQLHEDSYEPLQVVMVNGHQPLQHLSVAVSHAEPGPESKLVTQSRLLLRHSAVADSV